MSSTIDLTDASADGTPSPVSQHIDAACARIAPTWPLDRFIAVNPYWGWRTSAAPEAAATLGTLAGTSLTMPRDWFRSQYAAGALADADLMAAAAAMGDPSLADVARAVLEGHPDHEASPIPRMSLATDVADLEGTPRPGQTWSDLVTHQISQHCAARFDRFQGSWHPDADAGLFDGWGEQLAASRDVVWRQGRSWARDRLAALPALAESAIASMLDDLAIPEEGRESYLTSLLLSINGWAAWCAYLRWQARLVDSDDQEIVDLLAVRLTWEWLIHADATTANADRWSRWRNSWTGVAAAVEQLADQQRIDWLLQAAVERSYQRSIVTGLELADMGESSTGEPAPAVQAAFCIDVRSEVFRRAFESVTPSVHTRGFAGFFGLPIAYTPIGSELTRPQLPGLLAPAFEVGDTPPSDVDATGIVDARRSALADRSRWASFRSAPSSVFSFVESMGLLYGPKLVKESLPHTHAPAPWELDGVSPTSAVGLRPRLALVDDDPAAAAAIAHRVLNAMGLVAGFAPLVLLCGHGSRTANNAHAAGLDCGACGGQTGEVNARVLADLLNAPAVRAHLAELGIDVPEGTRFVAGLHNTTTDEVELFDADLATDLAPGASAQQLTQLREWLDLAGDRARAERAPSLGIGHLVDRPDALRRSILERSNDWSQVRPEWGLAGNASFVVAPRRRTRHLDLGGRAFLHDYDWRLDADLSVLTLIMTAPMVVTNWINLQYHASTVDNHRYGCGNKVLHNVVGGNVGVFEGNGGDLRIGLAMQSLHDGHELRHPPLRLSVFIEAPRHMIDSVIEAHEVVGDLVFNGWLHLLRIDSDSGTVERRTTDGWTIV
jgi:uncharacterized protein